MSKLTWTALIMCTLMACAEEVSVPQTCDSIAIDGVAPPGQAAAAPFPDFELDAYAVAQSPDLSNPGLGDAFSIISSGEPFVLVNFLSFFELAQGEGFEGLTGQEAYGQYLEMIRGTQVEQGSNNLWGGFINTHLVGTSDPPWSSFGVNEYASLEAFMNFLGDEETPEASAYREAGLEGQWGIFGKTLEENDGSRVLGDDSPPLLEHLAVSGLSNGQQQLLLDACGSERVTLMELISYTDGSGEIAKPWQEAFAAAATGQGAVRVWRGSIENGQFIGVAEPGFAELRITTFPGAAAIAAALADPAVIALSNARVRGFETYWLHLMSETASVW